MRRTSHVILALCMVWTFGCAGTSGPKKEPMITAAKISAVTSASLVKKYADVLPADLLTLVVIDVERLGHEVLMSVFAPSKLPEQIASANELGQELSTLYVKSFGIDFTKATMAIVVIGPDHHFWIIEGITPEPGRLATTTWRGKEVVHVDQRAQEGIEMWATVERRHEAMMFHYSREQLEADHSPKTPLSKDELTRAHLMGLGTQPLGLVTVLGNMNAPLFGENREDIEDMGLVPPDGVIASVSPQSITLGFSGKPQDLQGIKDAITRGYQQFMDGVRTGAMEEIGHHSPFFQKLVGLAIPYGKRTYEVYLTKPKPDAGILLYELPMTTFHTMVLGAVMVCWVQELLEEDDAAIDQATFEAQDVLQELAATLKTTYQSGTLGSCTFPPSATPSSQGIPTDGAALPVVLDATWNPYNGSTLHAMTQALFSYEIENQGQRMVLTAKADMVKGGNVHTESIVVEAVPDKFACRANVIPQVTRFPDE